MKSAKKITAFILAAVMMLSVFSVCTFAADTKTQTFIDKAKSGKEVAVTFTSGNTFLGSSTSTVSIKGNAAAYDFTNGIFKVRVVIRDNTAYAYFPVLPLFYVKVDSLGLGTMDVWKLLEKASGITFTILNFKGCGQEEVNGKSYYVETFNDRAQVTSKFCYEGDDLKLLNVYDDRTRSTQNTYFEDISFSVSDSTVAKPVGFDLTPLLKGIFISMITSAIM